MNDQNARSKTLQQSLLFYPTRRKMLLGFAGAIAFVVIGVWMVSFGDSWQIGMGIMSISFFGSGSLIYLSGLIHLYFVLLVNEEGIRQRGLFWSIFVTWDEIAAILSSKRYSASLNVYLSEAGKETFSARYPRRWCVSRFFNDLPVISLSPLLLPGSAQQIIETLQKNYQRQIDEHNITVS